MGGHRYVIPSRIVIIDIDPNIDSMGIIPSKVIPCGVVVLGKCGRREYQHGKLDYSGLTSQRGRGVTGWTKFGNKTIKG